MSWTRKIDQYRDKPSHQNINITNLEYLSPSKQHKLAIYVFQEDGKSSPSTINIKYGECYPYELLEKYRSKNLAEITQPECLSFAFTINLATLKDSKKFSICLLIIINWLVQKYMLIYIL